MKRLFTLIATLFFATFTSWAQIYLIDSFCLSASDGGFGIYADIDCEEWPDIYFDMETSNSAQKTRMHLSGGELSDLERNLNSAMDLFEIWEHTAHSKSMSLLTKKMPIKMAKQEVFFTQDHKWYKAGEVELFVTFFVDYDGECYIIMETESLESKDIANTKFSYGSYITLDGRWNTEWSSSTTIMTRYGKKGYLIFSSRSEVDAVISKLKKALDWDYNNRDMGELLLESPKKK